MITTHLKVFMVGIDKAMTKDCYFLYARCISYAKKNLINDKATLNNLKKKLLQKPKP